MQEIHEGLDFSGEVYDDDDYGLGIFSVKFSTDGRELVVASSNDSIYIYDLETKRPSLRILAHKVSQLNVKLPIEDAKRRVFQLPRLS